MKIATALFLIAMVLAPAAGAQTDPEKEGTFEGYWVATGERDGLPFPADHEAFVFRLEGSMNIETGSGVLTNLWATCIGLRDSATGTEARCVWENAEGERVFSELSSSKTGDTETASGRFIGGTGRLDGIEGGYSFTWANLFFEERDDRLSGFIRGIKGNWRLP